MKQYSISEDVSFSLDGVNIITYEKGSTIEDPCEKTLEYIKGVSKELKPKSETKLTPQQKAAQTRAANKKRQNAEDTLADDLGL